MYILKLLENITSENGTIFDIWLVKDKFRLYTNYYHYDTLKLYEAIFYVFFDGEEKELFSLSLPEEKGFDKEKFELFKKETKKLMFEIIKKCMESQEAVLNDIKTNLLKGIHKILKDKLNVEAVLEAKMEEELIYDIEGFKIIKKG